MHRRARARRGERILAGIGARQLDQFRHRLGRNARPHDQEVGQRPQHGDRGEVLGRIVRQLGVERGRDGVAGDAVEADRVAVGRRMGDRVGADIAARAALVLDDELLAGELAQLLAGDAREHVGRTAGREGVDVAHRLVRPVVGGAGDARGQHRRGEGAAGEHQRAAAGDGVVHDGRARTLSWLFRADQPRLRHRTAKLCNQSRKDLRCRIVTTSVRPGRCRPAAISPAARPSTGWARPTLGLRHDGRRLPARRRRHPARWRCVEALADRADPDALRAPLRRDGGQQRRAVAQHLQVSRHVRAARLCAGRGRCARHRRQLRHARRLPQPARARRLPRHRRLDRGPDMERRPDRRHRHLLSRRGLRFPRQHRPSGGEGDRAAVRGVGHLGRQLLSGRPADQEAGAGL